MAIEIVPAILPKNFYELEHELERLRGAGGTVQIDLVGENILAGQEAMPMWEEFDFEFDLMLPNPAAEVAGCVALGASRICIHADAKTALDAVQSLQHLRGGSYATDVGVALRVDDTVDVLKPFHGLYDYVQVMGIARVGLQGEPFDGRAVSLVRELRTMYPELLIQVDGGVDASNIVALKEAGATRLVCGHAILNAEDPVTQLRALQREGMDL